MTIEVAADSQSPPEAPKRKALPPLRSGSISLFEGSNNVFNVTAHPDTVPDDYLNPMLFLEIAEHFNQFDTIRLVAADATWWAELLVVEIGRDSTKCHLLREVFLDNGDIGHQDLVPGFQVRAALPGDFQQGFMVINRETGNALNGGVTLASYNAAVHFLRQHPDVHPRFRSSGLVG